MRTTKLRSVAAVGILWLAMGAGCSKDPPGPEVAHSCDDATCCMQDTRFYDYVEIIENEPADLGGKTLIFKNGLPTKAEREEYKAHSVSVCEFSLSKIDGLARTTPLAAKSWVDFPFRYRVWGKVYGDRYAQTIIASPILFIYVDRIEEVK